MIAAQRKSRPAAGTAGPADDEGAGKEAYGQAAGKASTPPPWFRLDASKWRGMTADLKAAERGMLIDLLMQIHQRGEPIINDPTRLARACGTTKVAFERALTTFLADGRIVVSAGKLWSHYIEAELDNCEKRSQAAKEKASKRWEKSQQNQSDADAAAYRYKDSKIVEGAPMEPPSFTDDSDYYNPDAHPTGASDDERTMLSIGDPVEVGICGICTVVRFGLIGEERWIEVGRKADDRPIFVPVNEQGRLMVNDAVFQPEFVDTHGGRNVKWVEPIDCPIPMMEGRSFHAA